MNKKVILLGFVLSLICIPLSYAKKLVTKKPTAVEICGDLSEILLDECSFPRGQDCEVLSRKVYIKVFTALVNKKLLSRADASSLASQYYASCFFICKDPIVALTIARTTMDSCVKEMGKYGYK